jgi:hypothetical protein
MCSNIVEGIFPVMADCQPHPDIHNDNCLEISCYHGMVYAAPMNENHEEAVRATGRSPLRVSCISWFKSIFTVKN